MRPKSTIRVIAIITLIAMVLCAIFAFTSAKGEEECWILCQPDSWVYARSSPTKKANPIGRFECGDMAYTDGKTKHGFLHIINCTFEECEGWINVGYIVFSKPYKPMLTETTVSSNGRVAARKTIKGSRRCWLKDGQAIRIYMVSDEWSVTNKGFVKTKFLNVNNH